MAPAGEVPFIGEIAALGGFGVVDGAIDAVEEFAGAIGFFCEGETGAVLAEAGVVFDEFGFGEVEEAGDCLDIVRGEDDFTGPAAAVGAALALVMSWRGGH